ncbi:protein transport protein SFT2-like [Homarus americanus]|uniref:Vesicle transport protein n=1 Tax=Homarus americanus TaxID=6706 RepID=A0A8J5K1D2_HOMAM|nr:protein transport protein SFT2-like [Homarus americanus]KAG7165738.1 transport protein SFT2-like [Homarus americanus]
MTDLNRELKEYLSRGDGKSESKVPLLPTTISDIKIPKISSWFTRNGNAANEDEDTASSSSWSSSPQSDPCLPSLGRKQRILGFLACVVMGLICFSLAAMYFPLLVFKARKFALLFTLGSLFSVLSFSFLWGPVNHLKHLFSSERLMFTSIYFISLFGTLYFALSLQSTVLTSIGAIVQVAALLCFVLSNIPGGQTGLKFFSSICSSVVKTTVSKALPV